jgi:hypothetical protein
MQVRDVVYLTLMVPLHVLIPGGMCAPPGRLQCPALVVLRTDVRVKDTCRARGTIIYTHGRGAVQV